VSSSSLFGQFFQESARLQGNSGVRHRGCAPLRHPAGSPASFAVPRAILRGEQRRRMNEVFCTWGQKPRGGALRRIGPLVSVSLHSCSTCSYHETSLVFLISSAGFTYYSGGIPRQVEVIDGHNLPKVVGQLSINPYVVLTLDGHAFARSSTIRGAAFPVWCSEVFMVKLPPPPVGEWHLTAQSYFAGYK